MKISEALVGSYYRSTSRRGLSGEIKTAVLVDNIHTGIDEYAYRVTFTPVFYVGGRTISSEDKYAIVYITLDN